MDWASLFVKIFISISVNTVIQMRLINLHNNSDLTVRDINGMPFSFTRMRGKRMLLSFFHGAACPFCQYRLQEVVKKHKEWASAGIAVEVVMVFEDTSKNIRNIAKDLPYKFTLIADAQGTFYQALRSNESQANGIKTGLSQVSQKVLKLIQGEQSANVSWSTDANSYLFGVDGEVIDKWVSKSGKSHIPLGHLKTFGTKMVNDAQLEFVSSMKEMRERNIERIKQISVS